MNWNVPLISVGEEAVIVSVPLVLEYTTWPLLMLSAPVNPACGFVPSPYVPGWDACRCESTRGQTFHRLSSKRAISPKFSGDEPYV